MLHYGAQVTSSVDFQTKNLETLTRLFTMTNICCHINIANDEDDQVVRGAHSQPALDKW